MAINVFGGRANAVVARSTKAFSEIPELDSDSIEIIYEIGDTLKSWVPNREINPLSEFKQDRGYYIVAKTDIDLGIILSPPNEGFNFRFFIHRNSSLSFNGFSFYGVSTQMPSGTHDVTLEFDLIPNASGIAYTLTGSPTIPGIGELDFKADYLGKPLRFKINNGEWVDRVFSGVPI